MTARAPGTLAKRASLAALLVALGPAADAADRYRRDQIAHLSAEPANTGTIVIAARPRSETRYFCPGARLTETNSAVRLVLVRCPVNATCPVDVLAMHESTSPGVVFIRAPDADKQVVVAYPSGDVTVWP